MSNKGFLKNTLTLLSGNVLAQIITIIFIPVITRIYNPEAFGQFSLILSISVVLASVSSLRFTAAILLPNNEADSDAVTTLSLLLALIFSLAIASFILIFIDTIAYKLDLSNYYILYFLPAIVLLTGLKFAVDTWFLREKGFKGLAYSKVYGAITDRVFTIVSGALFAAGPVGLLVGKVTGIIISVLTVSTGYRGRKISSITRKTSISELVSVAVRYKRFPLYSWSSLLQQLTVQLPIIMLGILFDPVIVGLYALAKGVLIIPSNVIGASLQKSFFQKISDDKRNEQDLIQPTMKLLRTMLLFLVVPGVVFSLLFEDLFALLFGTEWAESGMYAMAITPLIIAVFVIRPISVFFDLFEKQRELSYFNLLMLAVGLAVFYMAAEYFEAYSTLVIYSLLSTLIIIIRIITILGYIGVPYYESAKLILKFVLLSTSLFICVRVTSDILNANLEVIVTAILVLYMIFVYYKDEFTRSLVQKHLIKKC